MLATSRYVSRMHMGYYNNCVGWDSRDVHVRGGLCDMIRDAVDITRATFLRHVDREQLDELAQQLGYERYPSRGLTMAQDWHVSYHRSKLHGRTVYFFKHSAIEYVFSATADGNH
jgi:hypothetical protein